MRACDALAVAIPIALATARASTAQACAVCAAGDPTMTAMGAEKPFEGRVRGALAYRAGEVWEGDLGRDATRVFEHRLDVQAVYAPLPDVIFSADMPLLYRHVVQDGAGHVDYAAPGDIELRARYVAWSSRSEHYRQSLSFYAGVKGPTAPLERDVRGAALAPDLEPGCGSIVPLGGASYALSRGPYSLLLAASVYLPFSVRTDAPHTGDSLRTQSIFQVQPKDWIAARLGFDTKIEEPGTFPSEVLDPNSGGFVGYVSSELSVVPREDWLVTVGAFFPAVQAVRGTRGEGPIVSLSVALDF